MAGLVALALSYIMSQFYRSFLAVLTPDLAVDPGMSANQMSTALGAWFIAFACAQFAVGPLLDRIGPRRTAAAMHLVGAFGGAALFAVATAPWMIIAGMALIGIGCAPVLMGAFYVFRKLYAPARLALLSSVFITIGNLGNLAGTKPLAWMVEAYSWRPVMWGLAVTSALIAIAIYVFLKDPAKTAAQRQQRGSYLDVLKIRQLWPIFPLMGVSYAAIANLRGLWMGPYLDQVHGYSAGEIGTASFTVALGMVTGAIVYGPLDNLFGTRKWIVASGVAVMLAMLILWAVDPFADPLKVTVLLTIAGACGSAYAVIMTHGLAFIPDHLTGRGSTLLNFFSIGGTGVLQWISGGLFAATTVEGEPTSGFTTVLWLYPLMAGGALLIYLFSKDAKPGETPA